MFKLTVGEKEYTIRYDYRALADSDILNRVMSVGDADLAKVLKDTAEFLLVGLQRYHSDEFGFETDQERKEALKKVYYLMDEMDEHDVSITETFLRISKDLESSHFLSEMMAMANEEESKPKSRKKTTEASAK